MDLLADNGNFTLYNYINGPTLSVFIALEMVVGFFTNMYVILITFWHPKSWKQSSTIFLTSLLLADLVLVIIVMPFSVISTGSGEWIFGHTPYEKNGVCQFTAFMMWYGVLLVTMTLAVISFDRFLFIVKPFAHKKYMKPYTAVIIVVIVWISCAILNTTPLYGLGKFIYAKSHGNCVPGWENETGYVVYMLLIFALMVSCIVITSIWTCCFTHKFLKRTEQNHEDTNYISKRHKVIGIFGMLLLMSVVCFGPSFVIGGLSIFLVLPAEAYGTVVVCGLFITVANPLSQSFFRQDVKTATLALLKKLTRCKQSDNKGSQSTAFITANQKTTITVA